MNDRLKRIRLLLTEQRLDAVLVSSPANIIYTSGFSGFSSVERDGYLLITNSAGYILTSPLYADGVKSVVKHLTLITYSGNSPLSENLKNLSKKHRLERVGIEAYDLRVSEWQGMKKIFPKLISTPLDVLRVIKTPDEIHTISEACRIADAALQNTLTKITPGMSETEVVFLLENEMRQTAPDIAFPTIVAFGKNAAVPHHKSGNTKLKKNDLILIDFGAAVNEYRSDMTRTIFIGKTTGEQKKAYAVVLSAQQNAAAFIEIQLKTGSSIGASDADKVARDYLISRGFSSIPHSLGHGIGLEVHESPRLGPNSKEVLTEGMVFSIEPGIYIPGKFGIRIEDLYTIRKGKLKQLTKFSKKSHNCIVDCFSFTDQVIIVRMK